MEYFKKELSLIKNDKIREQTIFMLERVSPEFFKAAASSTGKYHPQYALGEGGLYRHTKAAVGIAASLLELDTYKNMFDNDTKDYIIAALILHDSCKHGKTWESKYTKHSHPVDAQSLIADNLEGEENKIFVNTVGTYIASHMGQWNTCKWDRIILPTPVTNGQFFVHLCDYLASRKFLEYQFEDEE